MNTQTNLQGQQNPTASVIALLLPPNSRSLDAPESSDVVMEQIQARATTVTETLKAILKQQGYRHGGIND